MKKGTDTIDINKKLKYALFAMINFVLIVLLVSSISYAWFTSNLSLTNIDIDESSLSFSLVNNSYKYTFGKIGASEYIDYETGSVVKTSNVTSTTDLTMNKYDPALILIDPTVTRSSEKTNIILEFNATIATDAAFTFVVSSTRYNTVTLPDSYSLYSSQFLEYTVFSEAELNTVTNAQADVTDTSPEADIIYYKGKYFVEHLSASDIATRTKTFSTDFTSSTVNKIDLYNDDTNIYITESSSSSINIHFYLNIEYCADRLVEYGNNLSSTYTLVPNFDIKVKAQTVSRE